MGQTGLLSMSFWRRKKKFGKPITPLEEKT
jgi:hypothetical protein